MVVSVSRELSTKGQGDTRDISGDVATAVKASGLSDGIVTVFAVGSTAAITTIEFESGAVSDFAAALERIAPRDADYRHHARWGDDNGSSHVRAAMLGPSLTIPFKGAQLILGTWQQVVFVELDTRGRTRTYVIQIVGE